MMEKIQILLQKWRVKLGHIFALAILICAAPEVKLLVAGTAVSLLGEAIRILSAGIISKDETLSRSGPYAYVRNPLYVGSFLMSLGFCIAAANLYILAIFPVFFFTIYYATIFREEAFLRNKFGKSYDEFCCDVPRFLPRIMPAKGSTRAEFSWAQVSLNKEHEGLIATLLILALLWAMGIGGWSFFEWVGLR